MSNPPTFPSSIYSTYFTADVFDVSVQDVYTQPLVTALGFPSAALVREVKTAILIRYIGDCIKRFDVTSLVAAADALDLINSERLAADLWLSGIVNNPAYSLSGEVNPIPELAGIQPRIPVSWAQCLTALLFQSSPPANVQGTQPVVFTQQDVEVPVAVVVAAPAA